MRLSASPLIVPGERSLSDNIPMTEGFERKDFDILATDFRIAGMSGLGLARAIRNRSPRFPVIVISAYKPVEPEHVTLWLPKEYLFPRLTRKNPALLVPSRTATREVSESSTAKPGSAYALLLRSARTRSRYRPLFTSTRTISPGPMNRGTRILTPFSSTASW
jgi:hypothetical protein